MDGKGEREEESRMTARFLAMAAYSFTEVEFIGREAYCGTRHDFILYIFPAWPKPN